MKNGTILKSENLQKTNDEELIKSEMQLINKYTRRELTSDEVYIFSVVLCDNEVDRDFERFTTDSLYKLAELFVGKTGVFDHDPKAKNQAARIFKCEVEKLAGQQTSTGEDYYRIKAKAYLPKTDANKDFILSIDSGINKEVSVGCAVAEISCSICGENRRTSTCNHLNGNVYSGNVCHSVLKEPTDAYEWSFVAIPAQVNAGVVKAFSVPKEIKEEKMQSIIKTLKNNGSCTLSNQQSQKLLNYIDTLEKKASEGEVYRNDLTNEVVRLSCIVQPEIGNKVMKDLTQKMTLEQLKTFKRYYKEKSEEYLPIKPQLAVEESANHRQENNDFNI